MTMITEPSSSSDPGITNPCSGGVVVGTDVGAAAAPARGGGDDRRDEHGSNRKREGESAAPAATGQGGWLVRAGRAYLERGEPGLPVKVGVSHGVTSAPRRGHL